MYVSFRSKNAISVSSASSGAASGDEIIVVHEDEPTVKKATPDVQEVINSTVIIPTKEEPSKTITEDNVFIEAEVVVHALKL